jgi:hypothetical protein
LTKDELHRLARLGALRRLDELRQEEASIRAAFPDLGGARTGKRRGRPPRTSPAAAAASAAAGPKRKRRARKMSAAERKAVSERMRKYWAERRKSRG